MRRFHFTLLGVLSVFLLSLLCPSCRPQSDVEEATLELSATALTLPREGTAQTLTITTNQSSWSAFSPQEATWITLRQEGNTLYVGAQANASGQERTGAVLVQAGGLQRRVTVHQTAADVLLEAPESVVLQAEGGSSEVSFECNSDALTIELAEGAGWLRVDKRTAKTFTLVAEANADKHNRTAKITLTAGTAVRELEVTQLGLTPYIFPMLTFPSRLYDIVRYEHERGNTLLYSREETKEQYPSFRFLTKSKVVPLIEYQFSATNSPGFSIATLIYTDKDLVKGSKDFDEAVAAYGFVKQSSSPDLVYTLYENTKLPLQLLVTIFTGGAKVQFVYNPTQTKPFPTFSEMPLKRQIEFLGSRELDIKGKKQEDVRAFEQTEGSERIENTPDFYDLFKPKHSFQDEVIRGYFYIITPTQMDDPYLGVVNSVLGYFPQLERALWYDEIDGHYHLTDEVMKLFTSAGYEYMGQTQNASYAFANRAKNLAYTIRIFFYQEQRVLDVQAYYTEIDDGSNSVQEFMNHRTSQKKRAAFLRRLDALSQRTIR